MTARGWHGGSTRWAVAFLVSALLHALALVGLTFVSGSPAQPSDSLPEVTFSYCEIAGDGDGDGSTMLISMPGGSPQTGGAGRLKNHAATAADSPMFKPVLSESSQGSPGGYEPTADGPPSTEGSENGNP